MGTRLLLISLDIVKEMNKNKISKEKLKKLKKVSNLFTKK